MQCRVKYPWHIMVSYSPLNFLQDIVVAVLGRVKPINTAFVKIEGEQSLLNQHILTFLMMQMGVTICKMG